MIKTPEQTSIRFNKYLDQSGPHELPLSNPRLRKMKIQLPNIDDIVEYY
jgi:hypothetical protein